MPLWIQQDHQYQCLYWCCCLHDGHQYCIFYWYGHGTLGTPVFILVAMVVTGAPVLVVLIPL